MTEKVDAGLKARKPTSLGTESAQHAFSVSEARLEAIATSGGDCRAIQVTAKRFQTGAAPDAGNDEN